MTNTGKSRALANLLIAALLFAAASTVVAESLAVAGDKNARVSLTTQMTKAEHGRAGGGTITQDEFEPLATEGNRNNRSSGKRSLAQTKASANASNSVNTDFWIYAADVDLFNDHDQDGFFHGIDLLFDADTFFAEADVYAVIYLSLDGGPWNEYAATENFTIFGATSDDEYVVVTELLSGYPSGSYDILIELFDAFDDTFVASYGPEDTSELAFLPLEDADRDVAPTTVVVTGGGGSMGLALLALMFGAALTTALRRSPES